MMRSRIATPFEQELEDASIISREADAYEWYEPDSLMSQSS